MVALLQSPAAGGDESTGEENGKEREYGLVDFLFDLQTRARGCQLRVAGHRPSAAESIFPPFFPISSSHLSFSRKPKTRQDGILGHCKGSHECGAYSEGMREAIGARF